MQLLRLELGQGSQKENWPLGSVLGGGVVSQPDWEQ